MIGGVTRHILPHLSRVPYLHVNRLLDWRGRDSREIQGEPNSFNNNVYDLRLKSLV